MLKNSFVHAECYGKIQVKFFSFSGSTNSKMKVATNL